MYSETIVKLLEFMEKSGKTQIKIARETGFSGTVISQFISGTSTRKSQTALKNIL